MWVRPTEEELFERYSPELKQKSLEQRHQREKEFDDFVTRLKEQSKSDKNSTSPPSSSLPSPPLSPSRDPAKVVWSRTGLTNVSVLCSMDRAEGGRDQGQGGQGEG